jgi:hypothetical protein
LLWQLLRQLRQRAALKALPSGVAGHFAGHHGVLGAAAGCVVGRHEANKRDKMQTNQINQTNRELRKEEERF